jgi:hypothetical protein
MGFRKWINVNTTEIHYEVAGFRHEVDRYTTIRGIFKLSKLHVILSRVNFDSTEKAIAFEKWNKY